MDCQYCSLSLRISPRSSFRFPSFPLTPHPAPPLMVMALMTEETKRRHGGAGAEGRGGDGDGEIWEGKQGRRRKWKDEKCREVERSAGGENKRCGRSSGPFIKTIIVQDLRIPPGARVHVEAHIIN